jgi:SAM-dependent methyltransferase
MQGQVINAMVNTMVLERMLAFTDIRRVLDVGAGYGFFLREVSKRHQLDAQGVELSRQESDYATGVLGLNVVGELLKDAHLPRGSYDLVTSFEVIEHMIDPCSFLVELTEYVKQDGYLLIMTDNFASHMATSLGAGFPKWIPHTHVSHFSAETLSRTIGAIEQLALVKALSFTPWEVRLRNASYKVRGIKKTPDEAFDLQSTLASEMQGQYKHFAIRRLLNKTWARYDLSSKMDGDLMYFLCKKAA